MLEIEQKYHVPDLAVLESALGRMQSVESPTQQHADTYYNHPSRDFAETHEALRVRRVDGVPMVTYKGTKLPGAVKARRELEWRLDPGDADGTAMEELLTLLGFRRVAEVKKSRQSFTLPDPHADFCVTIDHVDGLGMFAEVELVVNDVGAVDQARTRIVELASQLGLQQVEPRSYLRMWLESGKT